MRVLSLILLAILSIGCQKSDYYWQITCSSGFKTPLSHYTSISNEGVLVWRVTEEDGFSRRVMLDGEACTDSRMGKK